jgi:hypothetical protein
MKVFAGPDDPQLPSHVREHGNRNARRDWVRVYNGEHTRTGDANQALSAANDLLKRRHATLSSFDEGRMDCLVGAECLDATAIAEDGTTWIEALRPGRWVHTDTGVLVDMSAERIRQLEAYTREWMADGSLVKVPEEHRLEPSANRGFLESSQLTEDGRLKLKLGIKDPATRERIAQGTIRQVSVGIFKNMRLRTGKVLPEVIHHVALTNDGIVPFQGGFRSQLSMGGESREVAFRVLQPERTKEADPMTFSKELLASLGLSDGATEKEVLAAIDARSKKTEELGRKVEELSKPKPAVPAAVPANGTWPSAEALVLASRCEALEKKNRRLELGRVKDRVEGLIKAGKITSAQKGPVTKLLLAASTAVPEQLSGIGQNGELEPINLEVELESFLSSLPDKGLFQRTAGDQTSAAAEGEGAELLASEKSRLEHSATSLASQGFTIAWGTTKHGEKTRMTASKGGIAPFNDEVQI